MSWLGRIRKRLILEAYRTRVRRRLRELYGPAGTYSPGRVDRAIAESRVSPTYVAYAYAMYCERSRFEDAVQEHASHPRAESYDLLRAELAAAGIVAGYGFEGMPPSSGDGGSVGTDAHTPGADAHDGLDGAFVLGVDGGGLDGGG